MEALFVIVGLISLVVSIVMIVKFFEMARDVKKMTWSTEKMAQDISDLKKMYVDGTKMVNAPGIKDGYVAYRYYKTPLEEISWEEHKQDLDEFVECANESIDQLKKNPIPKKIKVI